MATTTETTTIMTTITTTVRPLVSLTNPGDTIISVYNTSAGGPVGGVNGYSPAGEGPTNAIDHNITTKYLNCGFRGCTGGSLDSPGVGTGYIVVPAISNATIARALLFATANDRPNRDPLTVTLEGSTTSDASSLYSAASWTLICNVSTGINVAVDPGRDVYIAPQNFSNITPYRSYRLLITSQRNYSDSVQYAEGRILGYVAP